MRFRSRRARAAGQTRRPRLLPSFLPRASPCLQRLLRHFLAPHFSPLGVLSAQGQAASSLPPQVAVGMRRQRAHPMGGPPERPAPSSLSLSPPLSRHGAALARPNHGGLVTLCAAVDPDRGCPLAQQHAVRRGRPWPRLPQALGCLGPPRRAPPHTWRRGRRASRRRHDCAPKTPPCPRAAHVPPLPALDADDHAHSLASRIGDTVLK